MEYSEIQCGRFLSDRGTKSRAAGGQADLSFHFDRIPFTFDFVAIDAGFVGIALKQRTNGVVSGDTFNVDNRRLDPLLVDLRSITMFGEIAFGQGKMLQEFRFELLVAAVLGKLQGVTRIMNDLYGFQAREFVEEPSATGVHEHSVTLHLKKSEGSHLFMRFERTDRGVGEERFAGLVGAVQNHADVVVARGPGIADIFLQSRLEDSSKFVAQPVQRRAQRSGPLLIPGMPARIASTIAAPAFHSMDATP